MVAVLSAFSVQTALYAQRKKPLTVKEVMKKAHKDGLLKKVTGGKASVQEKKTLALLYNELGKNKPKKGSAASWKKMTGELVAAAVKVAKNEDGGMAALKAASNCKACHKVHK